MLSEPFEFTHFIVDIKLKGPLPEDILEAQRAFLRGLTAEGRLLIGGIVPSTPGRGMAILAARDIDEVRALYAGAPMVVAGMASIEIAGFRITSGLALGEGAG